MPVTITTADLVQPRGELSPHLFPQNDMDSQLLGWFEDAVARVEADSAIADTDQDEAVSAWVYYRAYSYIANQLAALPSNASEGEGAILVSYAATQFRYYRDLAAAKLAEFERLRVIATNMAGFFTVAHGQRGR